MYGLYEGRTVFFNTGSRVQIPSGAQINVLFMFSIMPCRHRFCVNILGGKSEGKWPCGRHRRRLHDNILIRASFKKKVSIFVSRLLPHPNHHKIWGRKGVLLRWKQMPVSRRRILSCNHNIFSYKSVGRENIFPHRSSHILKKKAGNVKTGFI